MLEANDKFMTIKEVTELAQISRYTLYRDIRSGKLPAVYLGRNVRIRESDAFEYAKEKGHSKRVAYYKKEEHA